MKSKLIYGFILMVLMADRIKAGGLDSFVAVGIALFAGLANMICSIYQGKVVATAIQASAKQPAIFGKCAAAAGIVETFSLFVFVFTLLII